MTDERSGCVVAENDARTAVLTAKQMALAAYWMDECHHRYGSGHDVSGVMSRMRWMSGWIGFVGVPRANEIGESRRMRCKMVMWWRSGLSLMWCDSTNVMTRDCCMCD